ncbi:DUF4230 domain-containing protein [Sphingobacterium sp. SG20118]|uniref:DUF4230 domain-containing protein n=1 Tax=Sphingobacterium TaxID=28453 RepID=UPI0004F7715D|nr:MULTISPECIES: DUF4230 domain-containing protein [Sphingobacterium]AIM36666.1 hypothetical protein KO02_08050 [Sphingobacterium sp. ML3W]MDH5827153.1 DUF4230 domain-containing protein [Sphingobacterium faecium]
MGRFLKIIFTLAIIGLIGWFLWPKFDFNTKQVTSHQLLIERIEAMGKLELVKYRFSDVVEHKNISQFLPEASVLLIIKADAVGCVDLTKVKQEDIQVFGDSVSMRLPQPEICYIKIDHNSSRVYDTKMAFFREANLVDEAYKNAEKQIAIEVRKSDILQQTRSNALSVFTPLLKGLGYNKISLSFE